MSRRDVFDAVIVGAGVVGSSAALSLAREGLRVAIIEARQPPVWQRDQPDLRVYAFAADAQALLASLGVWPAVAAARIQPYRRMCVWDAAGGGELEFNADAMGRDCLGNIVEHTLLVDRLWAALVRESRIQRHCPDSLCALEQDDSGVSLVLESGRRLRTRLLLGADGAASRVRELIGFASNEHDYGQRGLVAYVRTERAHQATCWQRFLPGGPLAFLPCSDGRSSIVWTLPEAQAQRLLDIDQSGFCRELTRAFDARLGAVTEVSQRQAFALRRNLAQQMLHGRVALIGDAAHVVHPLAGQGVNLGLRDVAALAALAGRAQAAGQDFSSAHRLQRWARARLSENTVAAHYFETINSLFSNDALLPTLVRGPLLALVGKFPPLTQFFWRRAAGL